MVTVNSHLSSRPAALFWLQTRRGISSVWEGYFVCSITVCSRNRSENVPLSSLFNRLGCIPAIPFWSRLGFRYGYCVSVINQWKILCSLITPTVCELIMYTSCSIKLFYRPIHGISAPVSRVKDNFCGHRFESVSFSERYRNRVLRRAAAPQYVVREPSSTSRVKLFISIRSSIIVVTFRACIRTNDGFPWVPHLALHAVYSTGITINGFVALISYLSLSQYHSFQVLSTYTLRTYDFVLLLRLTADRFACSFHGVAHRSACTWTTCADFPGSWFSVHLPLSNLRNSSNISFVWVGVACGWVCYCFMEALIFVLPWLSF